jgi:formylglycine-generating enzyme required for sulfatase activity
MRGAPRDVTRAALLICGAIVFLGAGLFARAAGSARAQTELPLGGPIVLIPSGDVLIGAREEAIYQAAALCRAESRFDGGASCTIERFANELHTRVAHVARFGIDRTEVSRGAYRACVASGRCAPSSEIVDDLTSGEDGLPVAGIDLPRAERYCAARGGRLPTEEEWTRAARGDDERSFPWGSSYDPGLANHGRPPGLADPSDGFLHAAPVGSFPSGASPFGVLDLAGQRVGVDLEHAHGGRSVVARCADDARGVSGAARRLLPPSRARPPGQRAQLRRALGSGERRPRPALRLRSLRRPFSTDGEAPRPPRG